MSRTPAYVQVPPDSTGKKINASVLTDSNSDVVERQIISIGDPATEGQIANVTASGALQVDPSGVTQPATVQPRAATLTNAAVSFSGSGDNTVVAAVSAKTTKVYRLFLVSAGNTTITIKDGSTSLTGAMTLYAGGSLCLDFSSEPWFTGSTNTALIINSSSAVQVSGSIGYINS
jgi:hypothetical protein